MDERIPFGKCPLCDCPRLADSALGNCSAHPNYHSALSPVIRWKQCTQCAHIFTEGYYTDEALKLIFGKTVMHQQVGVNVEAHRYLSARVVEKVLPYASSGYWLDIGFGNGSLLFTAQEYGFNPVGLDLRMESVSAMRSLGLEAYCKDIAEFVCDWKCSVISMADVLEHMPYPRTGLTAANRLLAEGGVLFVSMPNIESIVWKALDQNKANPYWGELEHYHNFSRTRLYALLREFGFEPVRYGISERYRVCMEVIAKKVRSAGATEHLR